MITRAAHLRRILLAGCASLAFSAAVYPVMAQDESRAYSIPSEDLGAALRDFGVKSGKDVVFDAALVQGKTSPRVEAKLSDEDALSQLLTGSGLKYAKTSSGSFVIEAGGSKNAQAAQNEGAAATGDIETVTVTGTNLRGVTPVAPVLSLPKAEIDQSGYTTAGQYLQSLPQNFSGGQNPGVAGVGSSGVNKGQNNISQSASPNLRGIGSDSTLTLIDGNRLGYDGNLNSVDISLVPLIAVEKIEVMTDGGSAIYGSDAVAGVVNVILRKNFDGLDAQANFSVPTQGGGFQQQYSTIAGTTFSNGSATLAYEYSNSDPLLASQRAISSAALPPFYLSPQQERNSLYGAANYTFTDNLSAHVEGLYSNKNNDTLYNTTGTVTNDLGHVQQYGVGLGIDYAAFADSLISLNLNTSGNGQQLLETLTPSTGAGTQTHQTYSGTIQSAELKGQLPSIELPTGTLKTVVGIGYRREVLSENGPSVTGVFSRGIFYQYGEMNFPLVPASPERTGLHSLDVDAAVRHEHYDQIGDTTNPKVGVAYTPLDDLTLRSSWGTSFRAPTLDQLHGTYSTGDYPGSIFHAGVPAGDTVLYSFGPSFNLAPQKSTSWTVTAESKPVELPGLAIDFTYFSTNYEDRIATPLTSPIAALSNPIYAPFVIYNPSAAVQQQYISAGLFNNFSGAPYNSALVYALIHNGLANIASQKIRGFDALASYQFDSSFGHWTASTDAAWLDFQQQTLAGNPYQVVNGTIFNPPSFKLRGSLAWTMDEWGASLTVNHVASETDNIGTPAQQVGDWTTVDLQASYLLPKGDGMLAGAGVRVSVLNLFDQDPPSVRAGSTLPNGVGFDAANSSAFGRTVIINLLKSW